MMRFHRFSVAFLAILLLGVSAAHAADAFQEVPSDALGFVLLHDIGTADAKVGRLASLFGSNLPRPLAFLKDVIGVGDGVDPNGDFLLVLLPSADSEPNENPRPQFCVWLPVADYDQFLKSVGAAPGEGITAITVAGEDLIVSRRGDWALVMDPDERSRMTQLLSALPNSLPRIRDWKPWIGENDVTVVAFSAGIHRLHEWLLEGAAGSKTGPGAEESPFRSAEANQQESRAASRSRSPQGIVAQIKDEFRSWSDASPELVDAIERTDAVACGLRLDAAGNMRGGLRFGLNKPLAISSSRPTTAELPPALNDGGRLILQAAGWLPQSITVGMATANSRRFVADFQIEEHTQLDEDAIHRLQQAVADAASGVRSMTAAIGPGSKSAAVYDNEFIALRVLSASDFVGHANEVMRIWNQANRDADGEVKWVFDVEETKLGSRIGTQYSLDMVELLGTPAVPEVRQAMEKLFGPGGKMRLWIVPVDNTTVLLALATNEHVTDALTALDRKRPIDWKADPGSESNKLLPPEADWRFFLDLHGYYDQLRRLSEAGSAPIIGGPLVKDFPSSPPVGLAGGVRDRDVWIDFAAPDKTVKSAAVYLNSTRRRGRAANPN